MKKIKILLLASSIIAHDLFAFCFVKASCEQPLSEMSQDLQEYIETSFGNLNSEIESLEEVLKNGNKELDKEIALLNTSLAGHKLLSNKTNAILADVKKGIELDHVNLSISTIIYTELMEKAKNAKK